MISLAKVSIRRPKAALAVWLAVAALTVIGLGVTSTLSPPITAVPGTQASRAAAGERSVRPDAAGANSAPATANSFAAGPKRILIIASAKMPPLMTVIHAAVSGAKLTIPLPQLKFSGLPVILTALKLNVPAKGSGARALITAGRCTSHKFVVTSRFAYVSGSAVAVRSSSPCK